MTFTETNTGSTPVTIKVGPSNTGFDVKENGALVWMSNAGIQPQYLVLETLQPGHSATFHATWNGISNVGGTSSPVTGTFTVTNQQAPSAASATFVIQPSMSDQPTKVGALTYSLTTNQAAYLRGQPIVMTFTETNTSNHTVEVALGSSTTGFDVYHNGRIVWQSNLKEPLTPVRLTPLRPGQSVTLKATWNGIPNEGSSAALTGTFTVVNQQAPAAVHATFQIVAHVGIPAVPPTSPIAVRAVNANPSTRVPSNSQVGVLPSSTTFPRVGTQVNGDPLTSPSNSQVGVLPSSTTFRRIGSQVNGDPLTSPPQS